MILSVLVKSGIGSHNQYHLVFCIPWAAGPGPALARRVEGKFDISWRRSQHGKQDLCKVILTYEELGMRVIDVQI
jgi:hypothetical protein